MGPTMTPDQRDSLLFDAHKAAVRCHRVRPYPGTMMLFRARDLVPPFFWVGAQLGWGGTAAAINVREVPGTHATLLHPPAVLDIAHDIDAALG
jgi:thioesterase domain-containing protein